MKMKKFEGVTEQEAIEKVMAELGPGALVVNIKTTKPRGFFAFLRKPLVEVTAAYDETAERDSTPANKAETSKTRSAAAHTVTNESESKTNSAVSSEGKAFEAAMKDITIADQQKQIAFLEMQIATNADMMTRLEDKLRVTAYNAGQTRKYRNNAVQVFYDALIANATAPDIAADMLDELDAASDGTDLQLNILVKIVYNMIVDAIGAPEPMNRKPAERGLPRVAAFIGSTGVGKTTTIAKLAAELMLSAGLNVGFITADTYRIAAVEQLKTYADILGIEVGVAYAPEEVAEYIQLLGGINDVVMLDTAGRSHKNADAMDELTQYIAAAGDCEKYLVLSLTTRWEDMCDIVRAYERFGDFKLIFTKSDETSTLGAVLNVCKTTGRKASYITFGQNVPDDIKPLEPSEIARALLGLGDKQ